MRGHKSMTGAAQYPLNQALNADDGAPARVAPGYAMAADVDMSLRTLQKYRGAG